MRKLSLQQRNHDFATWLAWEQQKKLSTRQKDKIQSNTKSKYIVFLVKKEMKAILFQMPIMPIMTFAPSYWCIRSANPFGRQKCPGSQLLHLEALGQEIGSQSLKDLRIYENQRWFKKNSKNSKDLHRDVRAALPGSSAVGGRPITAARRGGNGWRQHQWHQCRLQRDQRIYGFPRHPARHVATACHGTSSTFFTESIYTVAPLPCRTVLYHAVPSYHVWLHHFFHRITLYSHIFTYDHIRSHERETIWIQGICQVRTSTTF